MSYKYVFKVFLSIENKELERINELMKWFTWDDTKVVLWTNIWDLTVTTDNMLDDENYNILIKETQEAYTETIKKDIAWAKITLTLKHKWYESNNT